MVGLLALMQRQYLRSQRPFRVSVAGIALHELLPSRHANHTLASRSVVACLVWGGILLAFVTPWSVVKIRSVVTRYLLPQIDCSHFKARNLLQRPKMLKARQKRLVVAVIVSGHHSIKA